MQFIFDIDVAHLSNKYLGVLMIATTIDSPNRTGSSFNCEYILLFVKTIISGCSVLILSITKEIS